MSEPNDSTLQEFQNQLINKLVELFDVVIDDRRNYYAQNPHKVPSQAEISRIIEAYSYKNAAIVGMLNIVPGPLGLITVIPEIILVVRNQLAMIYDISAAYQQDKVINKELLAGIFASSLGVRTLEFLTIQGGKVLVKRSSLRIFQQIMINLGTNITQKLVKQQITRFLPGIGTVLMATWAKYSTKTVGKKASEILSKNIQFTNESVDDIDPSISLEIDNESFNIIKIESLINMAKSAGQMTQQEIDYIEVLIHNSIHTDQNKIKLQNYLASTTVKIIDYKAFTVSPDDSLGLLVALITLAKQRESIHITQKMYIKQVGKLLEFSDEDVVELLNT